MNQIGGGSESRAAGSNPPHQGGHDITKMSLTDDYFSDVNIKTMRRLMNVIYVIGRLLKAFSIDFRFLSNSIINLREGTSNKIQYPMGSPASFRRLS